MSYHIICFYGEIGKISTLLVITIVVFVNGFPTANLTWVMSSEKGLPAFESHFHSYR